MAVIQITDILHMTLLYGGAVLALACICRIATRGDCR